MRRTLNSEEVINYFSQFLTEISTIITNIKQFMFQLIEVKAPSAKGEYVVDSMPSIVVSTHRTYQDLRKIQSIISGYTRSRKNRHFQKSLNSTSESQKRSRSQENAYYDYPFSTGSSTPIVKDNVCFSNKNISMRSKFLKEDKKIDNQSKDCKQNTQVKVRWLDLEDKWDLIKQEKHQNQMEHQKETQPTFTEINNTIEQHLKQLFHNNQSRFKTINTRNKQCFDLLFELKQEITNIF